MQRSAPGPWSVGCAGMNTATPFSRIKPDNICPISIPILQPSMKKIKGYLSEEVIGPYSKIFLDPPEAILFVFLGHFDEVTQTFPEFFRSLPGAVDKPDADALVGI